MSSRRDFIKSEYRLIIEILSFLLMLCSLVPLLSYGEISGEDSVPIHYSINGQIDSWGDPSYIITLSLISLAFYVLLSVLQRYPKILNYPVKITPINAEPVHRLGIALVRHLKLFLALIFGYLNNATFAVAVDKSDGINSAVLLSLIAMLFVCLTVYGMKMMKYR
ncbi:MAG: hypothetical protein LBK58_00980 [Prevotellaceae bacterium]|jgi:hypothetical protein|nr:hypothetical protein [Prevotellaceae bacterium]